MKSVKRLIDGFNTRVTYGLYGFLAGALGATALITAPGEAQEERPINNDHNMDEACFEIQAFSVRDENRGADLFYALGGPDHARMEIVEVDGQEYHRVLITRNEEGRAFTSQAFAEAHRLLNGDTQNIPQDAFVRRAPWCPGDNP